MVPEVRNTGFLHDLDVRPSGAAPLTLDVSEGDVRGVLAGGYRPWKSHVFGMGAGRSDRGDP